MKKIIAIQILVCCSCLGYSQATITKPTSKSSAKSIKDFGAIPDDGKDDTWAFIKAGKYFSNLWDIDGIPLKPGSTNFKYAVNSASLDIPSGTYLVGKQLNIPKDRKTITYGDVFNFRAASAPINFSPEGAHKYGLELMMLANPQANIDQVVIRGTGKTPPVIKYNDGLVLGFFNQKGVPQFLKDDNYNSSLGVGIGSFLQTENCRNIIVENIEINGRNGQNLNAGNVAYGGGYSSHLIQFGASGIFMSNTKNVSLRYLNIHHMTLDGIVFYDFYKDPQQNKTQQLSNLLIQNTLCEYNRRQGLSWVGGRGVEVRNSKFNHTGQTVSGIAAGNPGAGVDIEPEKDPFGNDLWCMDGRFVNCEFINNKGAALVNDVAGARTLSIKVDSCFFHDVDSYALWIRGKGFTFNNCKIWGGFVHGNEGAEPGYATRFNNCDFADEEMKERPGIYNVGFALVESWLISKKMSFNNCRFRTIHPDQKLINIACPSLSETDFNVFSNCTFTAGKDNKGTNMMFGCVFDKATTISSLNKTGVETFSTNGVVFTGSESAASPYNFSLEGNILFSIANTNGKGSKQFLLGRRRIGSSQTDGFLNFNIGKSSCFYAYWDQAIDIGENAAFVNKGGGQFAILSGAINNKGKIILEDDSYTAFIYPITINTSGSKARFYYNRNAKMELSSFWNKMLPGLGSSRPMSQMKMSSNTKFHGNNSAIPVGKKAQ